MTEYWVQRYMNGTWTTAGRFEWNNVSDQKAAQTAFQTSAKEEGGCWRLCVVKVSVEDTIHSCCDE